MQGGDEEIYLNKGLEETADWEREGGSMNSTGGEKYEFHWRREARGRCVPLIWSTLLEVIFFVGILCDS
jgi:hypothetical protein